MKRWLIYTPIALLWLLGMVAKALWKHLWARLLNVRHSLHYARVAWREREWFLVLDQLLHAIEEFVPGFLIHGELRTRFCTWVTLRYDEGGRE